MVKNETNAQPRADDSVVLWWYMISPSYETEGHDEAFVRTMACDWQKGGRYDEILIKEIHRAFPQRAYKILPSEPIPERLQALADASLESDEWGEF